MRGDDRVENGFFNAMVGVIDVTVVAVLGVVFVNADMFVDGGAVVLVDEDDDGGAMIISVRCLRFGIFCPTRERKISFFSTSECWRFRVIKRLFLLSVEGVDVSDSKSIVFMLGFVLFLLQK
jgi:hypothetical protein